MRLLGNVAKFLPSFQLKRGIYLSPKRLGCLAYSTDNYSSKKGESEERNRQDQENDFEEGDPLKNSEQGKKGNFLWTIGLFAGVGGALYYFFFRNKSKQSTDENLIEGVLDSITNGNNNLSKKLLPDKIIDPNHPRPYTLVVDLDKFLVCHLWDHRENRWRIAKRPGSDLFLFYAAQLYEVIVYSSLPSHEGDNLVKKLDPFGCISYALYRPATESFQGISLKDVSRLNRDLSKLIVIGHDTQGFRHHPENMLTSKPWMGDPKDTSLEEAVDFLEGIAFARPKDLRPVLKKFQSGPFPQSYDQLQAESFDALRENRIAQLEARNKNPLTRFFGLGKTTTALLAENPTYWEKKRERMDLRRKEYAHVKDLMQKQLDAEMAKEKAFYKEHKMSLLDIFSSSPQPAQSGPSAAATDDIK
jgi:hypothetical protein